MTAPGVARLYIVASALALATMAERMGWFAPSAFSPLALLILALFGIAVGLLALGCLLGAVTIITVRLCASLWKPP